MISVKCFGIDLAERGILKKRPVITTQTSSYQGTIIDNEIDIVAIDAGGIFADSNNTILPNGSGKGEPVEIYEDDDLIFSGVVTSEKFTGSEYSFKVQSKIADTLRRILDIELVSSNPSDCVLAVLTLAGLYSSVDLNSFKVEKQYYEDRDITISLLTVGKQSTFETILNQLLDLMTAELFWYNGKLKLQSHSTQTINPSTTITSSNMIAYPSIDSDGVDSILNDYSISFVLDSDFPAADADAINLGYQSRIKNGTKSWSFDAGESSIIQILDRNTAHFFGVRKLTRFANNSPIISVSVLNSDNNLGMMDSSVVNFDDFGYDGAFEVVKIQQNGIVKIMSMQAINLTYVKELYLNGKWLLDGTYTLNGEYN